MKHNILIFGGITVVGLIVIKNIMPSKNPLKAKFKTQSLTYQQAIGKYKTMAFKHGRKHNIPTAFVLAIIMQESAGDPNVLGDNGKSIGLMQLQLGAVIDSGTGYEWSELKNPDKNIEAGTAYLSFVRKLVDGDLDDAIEAYNVGIGNFIDGEKINIGEKYLNSVKNHRINILKHFQELT